jgi:hypothetical protein
LGAVGRLVKPFMNRRLRKTDGRIEHGNEGSYGRGTTGYISIVTAGVYSWASNESILILQY